MIFNRHNYKLLWRIDLANFAWILLELLVFQILKLETCEAFFIIINMFVFFLIHALIVLVVVELKKKNQRHLAMNGR